MTDKKKTIRVSPEIDGMIQSLLDRPEMQTERQVIETAISHYYQKCNGEPFSQYELNYIFSAFAKSSFGKQLRLNCQETNILQKVHLNILNSLLYSKQISNTDFLSVNDLPHSLYIKSKNDVYERIAKTTKRKNWKKGKKGETEKGSENT